MPQTFPACRWLRPGTCVTARLDRILTGTFIARA
jgi:hypothetical protein